MDKLSAMISSFFSFSEKEAKVAKVLKLCTYVETLCRNYKLLKVKMQKEDVKFLHVLFGLKLNRRTPKSHPSKTSEDPRLQQRPPKVQGRLLTSSEEKT